MLVFLLSNQPTDQRSHFEILFRRSQFIKMIAFSKNRIENAIAFLDKKVNIICVEMLGFLLLIPIQAIALTHDDYKLIIIKNKQKGALSKASL